jgi:hypothetical protein
MTFWTSPFYCFITPGLENWLKSEAIITVPPLD